MALVQTTSSVPSVPLQPRKLHVLAEATLSELRAGRRIVGRAILTP